MKVAKPSAESVSAASVGHVDGMVRMLTHEDELLVPLTTRSKRYNQQESVRQPRARRSSKRGCALNVPQWWFSRAQKTVPRVRGQPMTSWLQLPHLVFMRWRK